LHAEDNAIAMVDSTIVDKTIFCTVMPCEMCAQRIIQANITTVYYLHDYRNTVGVQLIRLAYGDPILPVRRIDLNLLRRYSTQLVSQLA
jgi:deoxycytidylate deaminase